MTYQKAIDRQQKFHFSINTNDFDLRLKCWKGSLLRASQKKKTELSKVWHILYYPATKYRPYLSQCKRRVTRKGLSVSRNQFYIRESTDGTGEQIFMRRSKTTGCIKSFVHQQNTYEKWVLKRPFQAKMVQSVLSLADIDEISSNPRK